MYLQFSVLKKSLNRILTKAQPSDHSAKPIYAILSILDKKLITRLFFNFEIKIN